MNQRGNLKQTWRQLFKWLNSLTKSFRFNKNYYQTLKNQRVFKMEKLHLKRHRVF